MRVIDADAVIATLLYKRPFDDDVRIGKPEFRAFVDHCVAFFDAAPTLRCDGCAHEIEGVARACGASVSVWPDDPAVGYEDFDVPPPDFSCSRWEAK